VHRRPRHLGRRREDGGTGARPVAAAGLTAEVVQYRRDAQRDVVQVKVTNHGRAAVQVRRVEVRSETFTAPASADKSSTIGAGLAVDLVVPLAEPRCDGAGVGVGDAAAGPSPVVVGGHATVLVVDGTPVELVLTPTSATSTTPVTVGGATTLFAVEEPVGVVLTDESEVLEVAVPVSRRAPLRDLIERTCY